MKRDELILQHIPMTKKLIRRFKGIYPQHEDEIDSAAHYGLVHAVHKLCEQGEIKDGYTGYIYTVVRDHILRGVAKDNLIRVTLWGCRHGTQPTVVERMDQEEFTHDIETYDDDKKLEVDEFLATLTEEERLVLALRVERWTLDEIATKLGYSQHVSVHNIINRIGEKARKELFDGRAGVGRPASEPSRNRDPLT